MPRKKKNLKKLTKEAKIKVLIGIIPIIATLLILIGNTYAVFTYLNKSNKNIIKSGTLNLEVSDQGIVSIINSYPMSDLEGLSLEGYKFKITNTGSLPTRYIVTLEKTTGELATSNLRYSINNGEVYNLDNSGILKIDQELLRVESSNNYNLKLWISEDASNDILGQEFRAKLKVEALDAGLYVDNSGAAYPKLDEQMIPITFDENAQVWVKMDLTQKWYDYDNRIWANVAVVKDLSTDNTKLKNLYTNDQNCTGNNNYCTVNDYLKAEIGTVIPTDDIGAMFVWIPRYYYTLFNNGQASKINIGFENILDSQYTKKIGDCGNNSSKTIGCDYTHPAFTIGKNEITGIWVGKFETGTNNINNIDEAKTSILIKPNVYSLTNQQIAHQFTTAKALSNLYHLKLNSYMMKDSEWGAAAYLTYSQYGLYESTDDCIETGCDVWINNVYHNNNSITGCSSIVNKDSNSVLVDFDCNTETTADYIKGKRASTTGNIYGIYDMSGGSNEYTMASTNEINWANKRLYNFYTSYDPLTACNNEACYGYALSETAGWNENTHSFITGSNWIIRGGAYNDKISAGIFNYNYLSGHANNKTSFRIVLSK